MYVWLYFSFSINNEFVWLNDYRKLLVAHLCWHLPYTQLKWQASLFNRNINSQPSLANFCYQHCWCETNIVSVLSKRLYEKMFHAFKTKFPIIFHWAIWLMKDFQTLQLEPSLILIGPRKFVSKKDGSQNWLDWIDNWHFWWVVKLVISIVHVVNFDRDGLPTWYNYV